MYSSEVTFVLLCIVIIHISTALRVTNYLSHMENVQYCVVNEVCLLWSEVSLRYTDIIMFLFFVYVCELVNMRLFQLEMH